MSNNFLGILLNSNPKNPSLKETPLKKRGNSQNIFQRIPDIITQVKPSYLNNYSQPLNLHKSSFTPSNKSRDIFQSDLLLPQKSPDFIDKKTLILDLDETLVHSSPSPFDKNDIVLEVEFDGILYNIYVLIRPGAENFIKKMSKFFEVVIFTASISKYASPLLDKLDKENKIKYRLYREHCTFLNGIYIKELKRLNRDLKDLIIVDNSPLAFAFDSENGLPIKSWYDDKNDNEFENISILLEFLAKVNDVREYIYLFVENNEIKYEEAFKIINLIKKNITNINNKELNINNTNIINFNYIRDKKISNTFSLNDFLNKNKIIGSLLNNKNKIRANKNNLKLEDNKSSNITEIKNVLDKKDNNFNTNNNINNILIENTKVKKSSCKTKKNSFRLNKKLRQMSLKNLIGNTYGTKLNSLLPLTLSLTNTTKMAQFKKKDNDMNNLKLISIKDISNNNPIINNISKKEIKDNIKKYTNIIDKFETNKNIYTNSLINGINSNTNYKNNNINNKSSNMIMTRNSKSFKLSKNKNLLISSPLVFNQQGYISINKRKNNFINSSASNYTSNYSRSKSTGNFINFNGMKKEHPKTPKQRLYNLDLFDGKNTYKLGNVNNGLDAIGFNKTIRHKFTSSFKPTNEKIKIKKIWFKKEL